MMSLSEAFYLKPPRRNFQINVRASSEDRRVYFGRRRLNDALIDEIKRQYTMGVPPKKLIHGLWGAGKTHMLFNIKYQLEESPDAGLGEIQIRTAFVEGEFRKKTDFSYLHRAMMEAMGLEEVQAVIQRYLQENASPDLGDKLREFFQDASIAKAVQTLGVGTQEISLWKWLCGEPLKPAELSTLGLTKNLESVGEMTRTLVSLCRLGAQYGIHYLFLLDEMEGLKNVEDADAQRSIHDGFRKLAEDFNDSVGFIVGIYGAGEADFPHWFWEEDVVNRIGRDNVHDLEYLSQPEDVETFLSDLFQQVVDHEALRSAVDQGIVEPDGDLYPFSSAARESLIDLATGAPHASLPRNIIKAVNEAAVQASSRDSRIIEPEDLATIGPIFLESY